jgi:hypothetical protein
METNNTNNDKTENTEKKELTDAERREMLKKMAREAIKNVEDGKANIVDEKQPDLMAKPPRKIIISGKADIERKDEAGNITTTESWRAVFQLVDTLNSMPDTGTYNIYIKEDEEKSDLPGPGESRLRRLFQPKEDMTKEELMQFLASQFLYPHQAVKELQKTVALLGQHSQLKNIMITMVFDGARPSGFTYTTDASEETTADIEALGNASMKMTRGYMSDMKKAHPGQVSFEDDGDIILPNSVDASKIIKSAKRSQDIIKG